MKKEKKKFSLYEFFNRQREHGVTKDEPPVTYGFAGYFKLLGRKLYPLITVNIYYIIGALPLLLLLWSTVFHDTVYAPADAVFGPVYGVSLINGGMGSAALPASSVALFTRMAEVGTAPRAFVYVLYGLSALIFVTFGPVNCACSYIIRNMVTAQPVFMWWDFKQTIKRNLKQSLIAGAMDIVFAAVLFYALSFYLMNYSVSMLFVAAFYFGLVIAVLYVMMRHYVYLQIVTFELKIRQILKNAFIFALYNIGRNLLALLAAALLILVDYYAFMLSVGIGVILILMFIPALISFTAVFCGYPKVKQYMIDPYLKKEEKSDGEQPVFRDRG
ncbi:MAG: DUF624 domain-containing protein [Clostridia bacterium]|nr:DUF624 domain-containing protein [Clostridia bacterium]